MLPSFMKGGDIFLLYLCFANVAWVICSLFAKVRLFLQPDLAS